MKQKYCKLSDETEVLLKQRKEMKAQTHRVEYKEIVKPQERWLKNSSRSITKDCLKLQWKTETAKRMSKEH